uniref:Quino(Hemo)protein alcohol dehydrogenase, PQQ-dependent n=1 Tax=Haliea sp. ETY-M TaxID=1055105 RepID=A0A455R2W4_9GAMM|nr:quino(hemo)protein alcohol dehydrogenase, PQQ-dependent [Haliea sp. ETY-M]
MASFRDRPAPGGATLSVTMTKALALVLTVSLLSACEQTAPDEQSATAPAPVANQAADVEWAQHGLTDAEERFSPLAQINTGNVAELGLDWYFDYPAARGKEATPLLIDGVLYTTGSWSNVFAHDARTGELKWFYDAQVPRDWAVHLCCDVVNRGVAHAGGRLFVGTLDGRLVSLNASDGSVHWEVQTTDTSKPYSITGAPRIVDDKVIIGNGGAELGVRGYVSAYTVDSGELAWRFYTVPGDPEAGFENPALEMAAETWGGGPWWEIGGGGTVWDSMAYDPDLNLLYIGVGNGSPWNREVRSPDGGDNLFLSSIVALNPDDGSYVWHYQTTPGDSWDYTATQHIILADLEIEGELRQVLMQAPKNGFFYVLDRRTGELLSADAYATVTWASHVDMETGRPVEAENARYVDRPSDFTLPSYFGGHNWHPMSYHPEHGLVYIPRQDVGTIYAQDQNFEYRPGYWNTGTDLNVAVMPDDPATREMLMGTIRGLIVAWDPVAGEARWEVEHAGPWNGGMLSTGGNLLFQGNAEGELVAYAADTGEELWSFDAQTGIVAPPVTYRIDGEQYVAVVAGWGGTMPLVAGEALKAGPIPNRSRLLVFRLGGESTLPPAVDTPLVIDPPPQTASAETITSGARLYNRYCVHCHGDGAVSGGVTPDLRALTPAKHAMFQAVVLGGLHWQQGMVGFSGELSTDDAEAIRAFLIERAHFTLAREAAEAADAAGN